MYCKACGKPIESDWSACAHCGRPVGTLSGGTGFWDIVSSDIRPPRDASEEQKEKVKQESNNVHTQRIEESGRKDDLVRPHGSSVEMPFDSTRNNPALKDRLKKNRKNTSIGPLSVDWNGKNRNVILLGLCAVLLLFVSAGMLLALRFINPKQTAGNYPDSALSAVVDDESPIPEKEAEDIIESLKEDIEEVLVNLREEIEALKAGNGELQERLEVIERRQYYMKEIIKYMYDEAKDYSWKKILKKLEVPDGLMDIPEPKVTANPRTSASALSTGRPTPRQTRSAAE